MHKSEKKERVKSLEAEFGIFELLGCNSRTGKSPSSDDHERKGKEEKALVETPVLILGRVRTGHHLIAQGIEHPIAIVSKAHSIIITDYFQCRLCRNNANVLKRCHQIGIHERGCVWRW